MGGLAWKVGDRAQWLGTLGRPAGAIWNPPPPGWAPPTREQQEFSLKLARKTFVQVLQLDTSGAPMLVRSDEFFEFDPRVHISWLVSQWHDGIHPHSNEGIRRKRREHHDPGDEDRAR